MKKFISLLIAAFMSIAVTIVFSSCDGIIVGNDSSDKDNDSSVDYSDSQDGDKNQDSGEPDGDGDDKDGVTETPSVRTTVTEEEWNSYGNIFNFTYSMEGVVERGDDDGALSTQENSFTLKITENSAMQQNGGIETYMVREDGVWYELEKKGDLYYKKESGGFGGSLRQLLESVSDGYDSLTYDEAKKAYKGNDPTNMMGIPANYYIYFEDGKPTKIEYSGRTEVNEGGYTYYEVDYTVSFSDINQTEITLPEYQDRPRATLTEEEWAAFMGMENFTANMKYDITVIVPNIDDYNIKAEGWMKFTSDAKMEYNPILDETNLYVLLDGKTYKISEDENGNYCAELYIEEEEDSAFSYPEDLSSFIYDEEEGVYYYESVSDAETKKLVVRAEDGVVSEIILYMESYGEDYDSKSTVTMTFEDVGSTEISVPDFVIIEKADITEEQLYALNDMYNYTIVIEGTERGVYSDGNEYLIDLSTIEMQTEEGKFKGDFEGNGWIWVLVEGVWYEAPSDNPQSLAECDNPLVALGDMLKFNGEYITFDDLVYDAENQWYTLADKIDFWGVPCDVTIVFVDGVPSTVVVQGSAVFVDSDFEITRTIDMTCSFINVGTTVFE